MTKTSALPADLDPDELNEMIGDLAREMGSPWWASPDLVELDRIPAHVYGLNAGCQRTGVDEYKEGQRWRRKAIAELKRRPEWIAEWRAAVELDRRIEELCQARGYRFLPCEVTPWSVPSVGECPWQGTVSAASWPAAQKLRRQLIRELETADGGDRR